MQSALTREQSKNFARCIFQYQLWLSKEETEKWLETEEGQQMKQIIDALRERRKGKRP